MIRMRRLPPFSGSTKRAEAEALDRQLACCKSAAMTSARDRRRREASANVPTKTSPGRDAFNRASSGSPSRSSRRNTVQCATSVGRSTATDQAPRRASSKARRSSGRGPVSSDSICAPQWGQRTATQNRDEPNRSPKSNCAERLQLWQSRRTAKARAMTSTASHASRSVEKRDTRLRQRGFAACFRTPQQPCATAQPSRSASKSEIQPRRAPAQNSSLRSVPAGHRRVHWGTRRRRSGRSEISHTPTS